MLAPSTNNGSSSSSSSSSSVAKKTTHLKSLSSIGTFDTSKSLSTGKVLKESSLQFCMQMNEPDKAFGCKLWDPIDSENSASLNIWDYSDSQATPASSWSALPNRALLSRPFPPNIGRCTCVIVKEPSADGFHGGTLYSLYTNVKDDGKLAVAYHKRRNGKSVFAIFQTTKGILSNSDDSYVGLMTANLLGSKYPIWNQENGRQTILQLGRVDRYKYVMDFRYPLTGYQAFCRCLASIDSKLCCTM